MAILKLQLLGGFKATTESGAEIAIPAKKSRALLAILALSQNGGVSREKLATLLWSDRGEDQARSSLRQTLTTLRKELAAAGPIVLAADDQRVEFTRDAVETDAVLLASLALTTDAPSLRRAADLYQGELLSEISVNDPVFEDWLGSERRRLRDVMILICDRLLQLEPPVAQVPLAKRLLALDPLREASHLSLMKAYADIGERSMALQHYAQCRDLLKSELNVQPGPDIEQFRLRLSSEGQSAPPVQTRDTKNHTKPSIAVLNFANLSNDPAQRYFSDGITADIVTELSRFHQLLVHAHRPAGDGHDGDALKAGRALGVNFVAEGSVRRLGKRIRITVQLLDVETGGTVWSERFDADEEDIFAMQDTIVRSIVAQLSGRLQLADFEKASRKPPGSMAAYDYVLRGNALPIGVPEAEAEARQLFQKAIDTDPGFARAYAHLATYIALEWLRELDAPDAMLDQALGRAKKAVELDDGDEFCHSTLGYVYQRRRAHDLAEYHHLKALRLNPNSPNHLASLGIFYGFHGDPRRGIECFREAIAINPHYNPTWYWRNLAVVHFGAREYDEAITAFNRSPISPDWVEAYLAAAHAQLGQMAEAKLHAAATLELTPKFSIKKFLVKEPHRRPEDAKHLADALRKAGFTD